MQGHLFEMSGKLGYDSEAFIQCFMFSDLAKGLDSDFDYLQWAGKEYILERMQEEFPEICTKRGLVYDGETLFWAGYLYRWWHFYTGESSEEIYKQANAVTMNATYYAYHTMDVEMAIDRLIENKCVMRLRETFIFWIIKYFTERIIGVSGILDTPMLLVYHI